MAVSVAISRTVPRLRNAIQITPHRQEPDHCLDCARFRRCRLAKASHGCTAQGYAHWDFRCDFRLSRLKYHTAMSPAAKRRKPARPLSIPEILRLADLHHARTGKWPSKNAGPVSGASNETWAGITMAVLMGYRGLTRGKTLRGLLEKHRGVRHPDHLPDLSVSKILMWMDEFKRQTGRWPEITSGAIPEANGETWRSVYEALHLGRRGLPAGQTFGSLLAQHRGVFNHENRPPLTVSQILGWARAYRRRTRKWPHATSGSLPESPTDTWERLDTALRNGARGLPGESSLARLLLEHCGVQHVHALPQLTVTQVLTWADDHHRRTGAWPLENSRPIPGAPHLTWSKISNALRNGSRGLPAGSSLAKLLTKHRRQAGYVGLFVRPELTVTRILKWADAHRSRTGEWPSSSSGSVLEAPDESWANIVAALPQGLRGLQRGSTLASLLAKHRGHRDRQHLAPLRESQILAWADRFARRTGHYPDNQSGLISNSGGESWIAIDYALRHGTRGLKARGSLAKFLVDQRRKRTPKYAPRLSYEWILRWADAHRRLTGKWPTTSRGKVRGTPTENWKAIASALRSGARGLPEGSSLAKLLALHRGRRNPAAAPDYDERSILKWADAHHRRAGRWPSAQSGSIQGVAHESWKSVDAALRLGQRGLSGGDSLAKLLSRKRGHRHLRNLPPLSQDQIMRWARAHRRGTGEWPNRFSGPVAGGHGDTWEGVNYALAKGKRGLRGRSSIAKLIKASNLAI